MENRLVSLVPRPALALAVALVVAACGGSSTDDPDAGSAPGNARLVILNTSDILGLGFGERRTLRVRYETDAGEPIADAGVEFTLLAVGVERTGGAGLTATSATTDELGVARIDLIAGAENVSFRVSASAPNALGATFYITVSDMGFATLVVSPVHSGWRDPEVSFERIEVRLYRASSARCADIDIDDPVPSLFPPRSMASFGGTAVYQNLSAGDGYTIISWTEGAKSDTPLSYGCVELNAPQVPPARIAFDVMVADRDLVLPQAVTLSTELDMQPVTAALEAAGASREWNILACQAGPGQLLLDCALDALAPDGALDCVATGQSALTDAIADVRGAPDAAGCRPSVFGTMQTSLDELLTGAVVAGDTWPVDANLSFVLGAREQIVGGFELHTTLTLWGGAARHTLSSVRVTASGDDYALAFADTAFPVLSADQIAVDRSDPTRLALGAHSFTLRYDQVARWAFADLALESENLDGDALGAALAASAFDDGSNAEGCAAVSAIVCGAIGQPTACVEAACQQGAAALDGLLTAWWRALDGEGLDLTLAGSAPLYDFDGDLTVDSIGDDDGTHTGSWQVGFAAGGSIVTTTGEFGTAGVIE